MAEFDLAVKIREWKAGFEALYGISEKQLSLIKGEEPSEALWDRLRQLIDESKAVQAKIEGAQSELEALLDPDELRSVFREEIQSLAVSARVLTFEAAHKIETMMISTGSELQTTKTQRKLFDAYSGMNSDDQISYYFDERK